MIISPQYAHEAGIITNIANPDKQVGSDGIDLTLFAINQVNSDADYPAVLAEDKKKTMHRQHELLQPVNLTQMYGIERGYILEPGTYDIVLSEGCNLKDGVSGMLYLRSTLVRNGCFGTAGWHDNSYTTEHLGMVLHVKHRTVLEHGMRVAQIILWQGDPVKGYNGTYQNQVGTDWKQTAAKNVH
jgi:dUTP pyrophosphatase